MSMKQELETWVSALQHYDHNEFEESIKSFQPIADTSKILFNCGVIRATLGEHEAAVQYYQRAIGLDQYLAIAYFQAGVSNFLTGDFEEALTNFNDTLLYLRGNSNINYEQLGLGFKLYACEALFNRGLCYIYLQAVDTGLQDMIHATKEKAVDDHNVIDEAIKERAEGYTVFSIPVGVVFRPSEAKVKNVRTRDYLGKTQVKLVASGQSNGNGSPHTHRRNVSADSWARDDRRADKISFAATNLVKPNLVSRARQQSEPAINRNMFPPTPPPKVERPQAEILRAQTVQESPQRRSPTETLKRSTTEPVTVPRVAAPRSQSANRAARPGQLELGAAAFDREKGQSRPQEAEQAPRRGTARSASERPAERRRDDQERYRDRDRDRSRDRERSAQTHSSSGQRRPSKERLFGSVEHNERVDDVSARLYRDHTPSTISLSVSTTNLSNTSTSPTSASTLNTSPLSSRSGSSQARPRRSDNNRERRQRPHSIEEEDEDGLAPEVVDDIHSPQSYARSPIHANNGQTNAGSTAPRHESSLRSLRIKVHVSDDTRFIIVPPSINYPELVAQVAKKFALSNNGSSPTSPVPRHGMSPTTSVRSASRSGSGSLPKIKIRTKDEDGDLITLGDQEDLEYAIGVCEVAAKKESAPSGVAVDVGKMEFWVQAM